jgi:type I restriction enzyme S subunit
MLADELRKTVLQSAIKGELTEQLSSDSSVDELLANITKEKARLIKEKKIKKSKPLAQIRKEEIPFNIPKTWRWVRLGEIGDWSAGSTPLRSNSEYYGGTIPWLKTGDLNDSYINQVSEYITEEGYNNSSVRLNPIGSILIAMYGATIGKLGILNIEATTNQACCACIPYKGIYNKFLFYYLLAKRNEFIKLGMGSGQPNISKTKIVSELISLPPIEEQQRIVDKVEATYKLIDEFEKTEIQLTLLKKQFPNNLKASLLQSAIKGELTEQLSSDISVDELIANIDKEKARLIKEKKIKKSKPLAPIREDEIPFDIPKTWRWVRLDEICTKVVDGDHNPPKGELCETEFLMGSSLNVNNDDLVKLDIGSLRYLSEKTFKKINERTKVVNGDILFTCVGTLGRSCIFNKDLNITFQRSVTILSTMINNKFLKYYLDSPIIQSFVIQNASGTAQKGFYLSQMKHLIIAIPPIEEQQRIVDKLDIALAKCDDMIEK